MTEEAIRPTPTSSPSPSPFNDLPALVWQVAPELGGQGFNRSWQILTGRSESKLGGDRWLDVIHPEDRKALAFLRSPTADPAPCTLDVRILDQDGRYRWFLVTCGRGSQSSGRTLIALDIDDRKFTENAREVEQSDVREMLDNAPTMMWRTTAAGEMDYANGRYLQAWQQTSDQIRGWGWQNSVHPEDRDGIVNYWAAHRFKDSDGMYEFRAGTPETGYRWYLSVCTARRDHEGNVLQWYGATFDIEDRKHAEEELRRSEAFLRHGQTISKTGSVGANLVTNEHFWSEETYRILELPPSAEPSFETYLQRVHPSDREHVLAAFEQIRSSDKRVELEHRLIMPDGRTKHLRVRVNPAHPENGEMDAIGVIMDVTTAKIAEEDMHRAQEDLTRVARIATVAELTASIAHEINQPLSGILTNSEACLRWINRAEPNIGEAREAIERTVVGARRASEVVRQLRALFSSKGFDPIRFDLGDLIKNTLPLMRSHVNQHRAVVALDLASDLPPVFADPVQIQQVIINLVMNGLQAPGKKGTGRRIVVETAHDAGEITLNVRDDGLGIAESHLPRVFEPFFTTRSEGMGMGLSICRSIVESCGGRIYARNSAAGGATVGVSLPTDAMN